MNDAALSELREVERNLDRAADAERKLAIERDEVKRLRAVLSEIAGCAIHMSPNEVANLAAKALR